jgi:hypothetical protein
MFALRYEWCGMVLWCDHHHCGCRYVNQPEPELKGPSVTIKATEDRIQQMHREADQIWPPELAQLMKVGPHRFTLQLS